MSLLGFVSCCTFTIFNCVLFGVLFFFFKQKTAYELRISDWSSDVCSSDLAGPLYGMVLPILISVSVAPGSYLPAATAAAGSDRPAAVSNAMASLRFMGSSLGDGMAGAFLTPRLLSFEPAPDMGDGEADQPCRTRWHEVDDEQDDDEIGRAH